MRSGKEKIGVTGLVCTSFLFILGMTAVVMQMRVSTDLQPTQRNPQNERVAVCIAGSPRTFRHNVTHTNILKTVVQQLRRVHTTDVFFLLRMEDAISSRQKYLAVTDQNTTLNAVKNFNASFVKLLNASDDLPKSRIRRGQGREFDHYLPPTTCILPENTTSRVPDALFRSRQCLEAIEQHEQKRNVRYSWVYRTRPDIIFFDGVIMPSDLRTDTFYSNQGRPNVTTKAGLWWRKAHWSLRAGNGPVADQIGMMSRSIAATVLRAFDATEDCELFAMPPRIGPEEILRFWLMKKRVRYEALPFDWAIIREYAGPECKRLFWQHGHTANWTRSMHRCIQWGADNLHLFPEMNFRRESKRLRKRRLPRDLMTW